MTKQGLQKKSAGVQYMRAFACLMVFFSHLLGVLKNPLKWGSTILNNTPLRIFWGGGTAVIIFFLLSGFFLGKNEIKLNIRSIGNSILSRHLRIYPSFLLAFALSIIARNTAIAFDANSISPWAGKFWMEKAALKQYILSLFLISPFDVDMLNPVIWTLRIELRFCFVLPFFCWSIKRVNPWLAYLASILLGYVSLYFKYLPVFVLGMCLYEYRDKMLEIGKTARISLGILAFGFMDLPYVCKWTGISISDFVDTNVTVIGAALLLVAMYPVKGTGILGKVLLKIGDLSYYTYLVHMIVLLWFRFLYAQIGFAEYALVCAVVTWLLAVCLCMMERFGRKKIRNLHQNDAI